MTCLSLCVRGPLAPAAWQRSPAGNQSQLAGRLIAPAIACSWDSWTSLTWSMIIYAYKSVASPRERIPLEIPHWTTGRLWLMRLGLALLTMDLEKGTDWAWLVDHSVQIGQDKCLVILGIRLRDMPAPGECLQHQDLHLIALVPSTSWTRQDVADAFEEAVERTG